MPPLISFHAATQTIQTHIPRSIDITLSLDLLFLPGKTLPAILAVPAFKKRLRSVLKELDPAGTSDVARALLEIEHAHAFRTAPMTPLTPYQRLAWLADH